MLKENMKKFKVQANICASNYQDKEAAKECFLEGVKMANAAIEQMETALEVCNQERKKHREEADFANAAYAKLQKEYESLLGASSLLL